MSRIIFTFINTLFNVFEILILADVILSYFRNQEIAGIKEFVSGIVSPVLAPFRMLLNKVFGYSQFDFSPLVAIIALDIIKNLLIRLL